MSRAKILANSDPQLTLLALTGAPIDLVERLFSQLPARDAQTLRRKMEKIGPIRLRDIENAQHELAVLASRLVHDGEIDLPPQRRFAAAA